jgi:hypothetical protein
MIIRSGAKLRARERAARNAQERAAQQPTTKEPRFLARQRDKAKRALRDAVPPKGQHGGVRVPGSRKLSKRERELQAAMLTGTTPLEYMLKVLRDPAVDTPRRDWAAAAAAPYVHARLASTELSSDPERPAVLDSGAQLGLVRQIAFALALGARLQASKGKAERVVAGAEVGDA